MSDGSEIGRITQLTTTLTHPSHSTVWHVMPQTISLAEHDRTLNLVLAENRQMTVERVRFVAALTEFRDSHWSAASADKLLNLLEELEGPKETPCPR